MDEKLGSRRAAKLELEPAIAGAEAPVAGQLLLQTEVPGEDEPEAEAEPGLRRSCGPGDPLRWLSTLILCAAFLGLVRPAAAALPGWNPPWRGLERAGPEGRLGFESHLAVCSSVTLPIAVL